jgi:hypothetical protein
MTGKGSDAVCTFCGQTAGGKSSEQPNSCEYCGSSAGGYLRTVILPEAIGDSAVAYVEGATYPQILLRIARMLIDKHDDKLCGIAIIVMHMACEIATERSLSESFARKGIQYLEDPMAGFLNGYNIANDKVRNFYTSLTGDEIQNMPFWKKFIKSARRRNNIVHKGLSCSLEEAEESFKAVNDFLAHLTK